MDAFLCQGVSAGLGLRDLHWALQPQMFCDSATAEPQHRRFCGSGAPSAAIENPEVSWPHQGLPKLWTALRGALSSEGLPCPPRAPHTMGHVPLTHRGSAQLAPLRLSHTPSLTLQHSSHHARFPLFQTTAETKQARKHRRSHSGGIPGRRRHGGYWQRRHLGAAPPSGREGRLVSLRALTQNGRGRARPALRRDRR